MGTQASADSSSSHRGPVAVAESAPRVSRLFGTPVGSERAPQRQPVFPWPSPPMGVPSPPREVSRSPPRERHDNSDVMAQWVGHDKECVHALNLAEGYDTPEEARREADAGQSHLFLVADAANWAYRKCTYGHQERDQITPVKPGRFRPDDCGNTTSLLA